MPKPKLKYRREQIAALKKLHRCYTSGGGLRYCPLCETVICSNCVWTIETGEYCMHNKNKILGKLATGFRNYPADYPKQAKARVNQIEKWIEKYQ